LGERAAHVRDDGQGGDRVVLSITGPAASLGVPMRDTLLMLQEQANSAGGVKGPDGAMHPIELTITDDRSVETETVLAIKQLLEQQVLAIIGPNQTNPLHRLGDASVSASACLLLRPWFSHN
jgi:ABC-type branched-subunit amino acid transport system substrate-binding protein